MNAAPTFNTETFSTQTRTITNIVKWSVARFQIVTLAANDDAEIYEEDPTGLMMFLGHFGDIEKGLREVLRNDFISHTIAHACAFGPGPRW